MTVLLFRIFEQLFQLKCRKKWISENYQPVESSGHGNASNDKQGSPSKALKLIATPSAKDSTKQPEKKKELANVIYFTVVNDS